MYNMSNYRFTQNEFDRRSNYWGCGGRMPERHELFTPSGRDEGWRQTRSRNRYTKQYTCNDNKRHNSRESHVLPTSPVMNKRGKNKSTTYNRGRGDQKVSPSGISCNNNRKCGGKTSQSLLVNIDTKNCYPRRVSICGSVGQDRKRLPTACCEMQCSHQRNFGRRRARSLTPAGLDCRPMASTCPRTRPDKQFDSAWNVGFRRPYDKPGQSIPSGYSPKRNPRRKIDCIYECVCFNDKSWSCSQIAVMKTFLRTATCSEAMSLLGVVRCLIRERYSTNNSNCTMPYRPNNNGFDCWTGVNQQSPDESNCTPSPINYKPTMLNNDIPYQPVANQNSKSVSFEQLSSQPKQIHSTLENSRNTMKETIADETVNMHYNSPVEEHNFTQNDTSEKKYLRNKSYSSPVVNIDMNTPRGENHLRPQKSWSGVITDCKSFLKSSSESRCQDKRDLDSKMADASSFKQENTQNNKSDDEWASLSHDSRKDPTLNHVTLPLGTHSCNTQLCPVGDDKGNRFYLSKKSCDQLYQFINPNKLALQRNRFEEDSVYLNRYLRQNCGDDEDNNDGNNSSTDSFVDKEKQTQDDSLATGMNEKSIDNSSTDTVKEISKNSCDEKVPKALLDITKCTQELLEKVSIRFKKVEQLWDAVNQDEPDVVKKDNVEVKHRYRGDLMNSPDEWIDDTTFSIDVPARNQIKSAIGEVVADNILPEDDECVLDLNCYEELQRKVNETLIQIKKGVGDVQIETRSDAIFSDRKRVSLLKRQNTWVKGDSEKDQVDVGGRHSNLKINESFDVSNGNSMTSLDTSSSLTKLDSTIDLKIDALHDVSSHDEGFDTVKAQFANGLKSRFVVIKSYRPSSPLPKEIQLHLQS